MTVLYFETVDNDAMNSTGLPVLRAATPADIPAIQRVRGSVLENQLTSRTIADDEVLHAITVRGRGWVVEVDGTVVAFAIGFADSGQVWALFVDPAHAGQGHGSRLHDVMVDWLRAMGCPGIWLTTGVTTRARGFYRRRGWREIAIDEDGEVKMQMPLRRDADDPGDSHPA
jgi:GNAT superfamily N-acetyltransferase